MKAIKESVVFDNVISERYTLNDTFDLGKLHVAYAGRNPNKSDIPKEVYEDAAATSFYCPIVAFYDRKKNMFGGHEVELVRAKQGLKVVNATHPLGFVLPCKPIWEEAADSNGEMREYFTLWCLLWKREEAYEHLCEMPSAAQSMECYFDKYSIDEDGYKVVEKMTFAAFCLLEGKTPCFDGASLTLDFEADGEASCFAELSRKMKEDFASLLSEIPALEDATQDEIAMVLAKAKKETEGDLTKMGIENNELLTTYRQRYDAIAKALPHDVEKDEEGGIVFERCYDLMDYDETYAYCSVWEWSSKGCGGNRGLLRAPYSISDEGDAVITGDFVRVFVVYKTQAELDAEKAAADEKEEGWVQRVGTFEQQLSEAAEKISELEGRTESFSSQQTTYAETIASLEQYKLSRERGDVIANVLEVYTADMNDEEYGVAATELSAEAEKLPDVAPTELEDKLFAFVGRKQAADKTHDARRKCGKLYIPLVEDIQENNEFGGLFSSLSN